MSEGHIPFPQSRLQSILSTLELQNVLPGLCGPPHLAFTLPNIQNYTREIHETNTESKN